MADLQAAPLIAACVALLLAAAGLLVWHRASRRQAQRTVTRFLDRRIHAPDAPAPAARQVDPWLAGAQGGAGGGASSGTSSGSSSGAAAMAESLAGLSQRLSGNPWLEGAGTGTAAVAAPKPARWALPMPVWLDGIVRPRTLLWLLAGMLGLSLVAGLVAGPIAGLAALLLVALLGCFSIWLRIQKIRRQVVRQLPGFIDAMVRLITIGNSTQAAFQLAIPQTAPPLQNYLERSAALVRAGVDLDRALQQTAAQVRVEEMFLLASILGLGVRYGGRADLLLERVATFMRDREQAENELMAMSAETRLSAWVLGMLPLVVTAILIIINPSYFLRMWDDDTGRLMIYSAVALQAVGVLLLYRLTKLD